MHYAVMNSSDFVSDDTYFQIINALISKGAKVNAKANDGKTPLHLVSSSHDQYLAKEVKLLLSKGADVNSKDNKGWTPLHYAVVNSSDFGDNDSYFQIINALISKGANVNARDNKGWTTLEIFTKYRTECYGIEKLLLRHGAK